jgi:hypothetical protein
MVVGFTSTYAISAYDHCSCETDFQHWDNFIWSIDTSPYTVVPSTNKNDCYNSTEILLNNNPFYPAIGVILITNKGGQINISVIRSSFSGTWFM